MSTKEENRAIISNTATLYNVPAWVPLSIAGVESGFDENSIGDNGTSFGLFQLHRGGLAPDDMSDAELLEPHKNATIAVSHMQRSYFTGTQQGLTGFELLKHIAFTSGWPGNAGVSYFEEHRPDYVNLLAKTYMKETEQPGDFEQAPSADDQEQTAPPIVGHDVPNESGTFTAYASWYISQGDTLSAISHHVSVPVGVLARFNKIENPDVIQAGDTLLVPREIRVRAGDTLSGLCEEYGAGDYDFIAWVNAHMNPDLITTGERIYL